MFLSRWRSFAAVSEIGNLRRLQLHLLLGLPRFPYFLFLGLVVVGGPSVRTGKVTSLLSLMESFSCRQGFPPFFSAAGDAFFGDS